MAHLQQLNPRPETRQIRVRFSNRPALIDGLARAQSESWVRTAHVDWDLGELVMDLAGGHGVTEKARHLRVVEANQEAA